MQHSKNKEMLSSNITGHQKNVDNVDKRDKIHRRNYENVKRLRGKIDNTIKFQSDPIGKNANLSKKTFSKETSQLLNKNLLFEHQKYKISTR